MSKMFQKVDIIKVKGTPQHTKDLVAIDAKMELLVNGKILGKFYLSPENLEDFALGYLLDERYINSLDEDEDIEITIESDRIKINLKKSKIQNMDEVSCYDGWIHHDQSIPLVNSNLKVGKDLIMDSYQRLIEEAKVWSKTGGTHVAALVGEGKFIVREDVSRHVAVDKVIGAGLIDGIDFSQSFIVCSGRIPPDRVVKLANVGIPIMVTKAAPTIEGLKIGETAGITLIGFLRNGRFNIYTHPHRIVL